jgi:hypothetical protein
MELFMKVETDIIAWIAASLIGRAVIMSVETFQTGVSVFLVIFMMFSSRFQHFRYKQNILARGKDWPHKTGLTLPFFV